MYLYFLIFSLIFLNGISMISNCSGSSPGNFDNDNDDFDDDIPEDLPDQHDDIQIEDEAAARNQPA